MTTPTSVGKHQAWPLDTWDSGSEDLQEIDPGTVPWMRCGITADHSLTSAKFLPTDWEAIPDMLRVRTNHTRPMTPLEQLTLEDLIEDALLLCVASRVACKGNLYEITMYGDRYTLTPRQTLAFLGGAVEAHRARWRLSLSTN